MKNDNRFVRFLNAARRGAPKDAPEPPLGFATRVAAHWISRGAPHDALFAWERLTRWGLASALVVCFTVFLVSYDSLKPRSNPSALDVFAGLAEEDFL